MKLERSVVTKNNHFETSQWSSPSTISTFIFVILTCKLNFSSFQKSSVVIVCKWKKSSGIRFKWRNAKESPFWNVFMNALISKVLSLTLLIKTRIKNLDSSKLLLWLRLIGLKLAYVQTAAVLKQITGLFRFSYRCYILFVTT